MNRMNVAQLAAEAELDRWMQKEWHEAGARDHWPEGRKAKWVEWKRRRSPGASQGAGQRPEHRRVTQPKVWVRGHVPKEFLDWVGRHWSHDDETRAILSGSCFEVWER